MLQLEQISLIRASALIFASEIALRVAPKVIKPCPDV
jgi:hypothetical protein